MINKSSKYFFYLISITFLLILIGCRENVDEHRHPLFLRATKLKEKSDYEMSRKAFNDYLLLNPKSYLAHNELAILCEEDCLNDKVFVIYHYKKYIALAPNGEDKENAIAWLESAEEKYLEELKNKYKDEVFEKFVKYLIIHDKKQLKINKLLSKYKNMFSKAEEIQKNNAQLRKEIAKYRAEKLNELKKEPLLQIDIPDGEIIAPKEIQEGAYTFYEVVDGDNLSKISQKVYGTSRHYQKIYDFNNDIMKNISTIKIGQKLKIPKISD